MNPFYPDALWTLIRGGRDEMPEGRGNYWRFLFTNALSMILCASLMALSFGQSVLMLITPIGYPILSGHMVHVCSSKLIEKSEITSAERNTNSSAVRFNVLCRRLGCR